MKKSENFSNVGKRVGIEELWNTRQTWKIQWVQSPQSVPVAFSLPRSVVLNGPNAATL